MKSGSLLPAVALKFALIIPMYAICDAYRQFSIIIAQPSRAILVSGSRLAITALGLLALLGLKRLTFDNLLMLFGASFLLPLILWIRDAVPILSFRKMRVIRSLLASNINFGKWDLGQQAIVAMSTQAYSLIIAALLGISAAGIIGVYQQLLSPLNTFYNAVVTVGLVEGARCGFVSASGSARRLRKAFAILGALVVVYLAVIFLFGREILELLYKGKYLESVGCLYIIAVYYSVAYILKYQMTVAKLRREPRKLLWSSIWRFAGMLSVGSICVLYFGISGAAMMILSGGLFAVGYFSYDTIRRQTKRVDLAEDV